MGLKVFYTAGMRKFYLLSGLLFCLSLNSYSQSTTNVGFKGGLSLGMLEISSFSSGSIEAERKFRLSVYAGFLVEYSLEGISEDLYAQLELQYVNSGAVAKATADVPETTTHLSQLTLPFVVKYRIVRPVLITAGIYWGLLLKVEQEAENETASDVTEDFKPSIWPAYRRRGAPRGEFLSGSPIQLRPARHYGSGENQQPRQLFQSIPSAGGGV